MAEPGRTVAVPDAQPDASRQLLARRQRDRSPGSATDLGQLALGDGLPNDFDHRPGVEGGLGEVDAFVLGDPLEEFS